VLTLLAAQPECLWDDVLPVEVKELPEDLAALDVLLSDHELLWPLVERWQQEFEQTGRAVFTEGRPTIALETYVRLLVLKQRFRWGYRTLVAEVSDSIHLRRFCRISLTDRVPDESTVRKLTGRQADPKGQARQAERVLVRRAVGGGDREHQAGRAGADSARLDRAGQPGRGDALARHSRRAAAVGNQATRGRRGWRIQARTDEHRADGHARRWRQSAHVPLGAKQS
jgi:hypothetical protein